MRKSSVIVVISLLNVAAPSLCLYYLGDGKPVAPVRQVDSWPLVADTKSASDNQLMESLNQVELESMITSNRDQQTAVADYQPAACQLVQIVHLLQHPGCQPKAIASFACSGSCTSFVRVSVVADLSPNCRP